MTTGPDNAGRMQGGQFAPGCSGNPAGLKLGIRHRIAPPCRGRRVRLRSACVAVYKEELDEDGQVDFKGKAKAFTRAYGFLASFLPYTNAEWEKLSILLNFLVPKLPAPVEEDPSKGILEVIDMDSYRVEKQSAMKIQLPDEDAAIEPLPL